MKSPNFDELIDQPSVNELADKLLEGSNLSLVPLWGDQLRKQGWLVDSVQRSAAKVL